VGLKLDPDQPHGVIYSGGAYEGRYEQNGMIFKADGEPLEPPVDQSVDQSLDTSPDAPTERRKRS
jgi:hypothetical protein